MAAEAAKIKMAQQKEEHKQVELHAFVYNEKLNQLKSDLEKIWLCDYQLIVTDLKKYVEQFCRNHQLEPEQQRSNSSQMLVFKL